MRVVELMFMSRTENYGSFGTKGIVNRISNWKCLERCKPVRAARRRWKKDY